MSFRKVVEIKVGVNLVRGRNLGRGWSLDRVELIVWVNLVRGCRLGRGWSL